MAYFGFIFFSDFGSKFEIAIAKKPLETYNRIYSLLYKNDSENFNKKMKQFSKKILKLRNNMKIQCETMVLDIFADMIVREFAIEITTVYHRLRCFPQERLALYEKFANHPYITFVKLVHQYYVENKIYICPNTIIKMINEQQLFYILLAAISKRSELFQFMYELYSRTIVGKVKPKYKIDDDHYSLKVFSAGLFIMEHIMAQN